MLKPKKKTNRIEINNQRKEEEQGIQTKKQLKNFEWKKSVRMMGKTCGISTIELKRANAHTHELCQCQCNGTDVSRQRNRQKKNERRH